MKARTSHAAALHRQAVATSLAAAAALESSALDRADEQEQRELAARLRAAATKLAPGWLGTPLAELPPAYPIGGPARPGFVRVGTAYPLADAHFPAVIPLLGTGHLALDVDGRDPRAAGLLRALLLRLVAAAPAGSLLVRAVDATRRVFPPFRPLAGAGLLAPPVADRAGLLALLAEAEQWVRPARPASGPHAHHERVLVLMVACLPPATEETELTQLAALAERGPETGLHLVVAGWPPAPPAAGATRPPLPRATTIALRETYALLSDPPGASFGNPLPYLPATGLNSPVIIDDDPPAYLVDRVCRELVGRAGPVAAGPALVDLIPGYASPPPPQQPPSRPAADGLIIPVGYDGATPVTLGFTDLTPHWLVAGRPRAGKTSFLVNILLGLCARYGPDDLVVDLVSLAGEGSFSRFLPDGTDGRRLPQLRSVRDGCGPDEVLTLLRELDGERERRLADHAELGVRRFSELPEADRPPRVLCLVDEFQELLATDDEARTELLALLERLGRAGRVVGIHLGLASRPSLDATRPDQRRDATFGQFPVRVALPGGDQVLQPENDSAAGLPLGSAVINTAGGLGGPRGATRGHERVIRFPDPYADPAALAALRDRLYAERSGPRPLAGSGIGQDGAGR